MKINFSFEEWRKQYLAEIIKKISASKGRPLNDRELKNTFSKILDLGMDAMDGVCDEILQGKNGLHQVGVERFTLDHFLQDREGFSGEIIGEFTLEDFLGCTLSGSDFPAETEEEEGLYAEEGMIDEEMC